MLASSLSHAFQSVKFLGQIICCFAEVAQLYISLFKLPGGIVEVLNNYQVAVINRLKVNEWKLNPEKPDIMLLRKTEILKDIVLPTCDRVLLTLTDSVKSLEIILFPVLSLEKQVNVVAKRLSSNSA